MSGKYLSAQNVERLPKYYMILSSLHDYGVKTVTSKELAHYEGIDESLVRKDLSAVDVVGKKRVGYNVELTMQRLKDILGIGKEYRAVLIGIGNLGKALINFNGFQRYNVQIIGLFDSDKNKLNEEHHGIKIKHLDELYNFVQKHTPDVGIIAVSASAGQIAADALVKTGVKAIWNFAPVPVHVPDEVCLRNENLAASLVTLTFWLTQNDKKEKGDPKAKKFSKKAGRNKVLKDNNINQK